MNIRRILLTGDDGYNSLGTRLLIRALKDKFELQIAATKYQQSGMGGKLSLAQGGTWGETEIDGVPAFWVDGSPADVMECAQSFFKQPFDLIISGVNLGANITSAVISSGTYSAAVRGLGVNVAPRAIAISWDMPHGFWNHQHDENEDLSEYLAYPGDVLRPLIDQIVAADFWGVNLLNINLPRKPSRQIRFTKLLKDITQFYPYPIGIDYQRKTFSFDREHKPVKVSDLKYDAAAITQGYISITPCAFDMTHYTTFEKMQQTELELDR